MKRFVVIVVILAALGYGGYYGWQTWQKRTHAERLSKLPKTAEVQSRDIKFSITAAGDIGPADQVSVRPEVNGRISELPVDIGDQVSKGQLLCRLDDQDLQIERSQRLTEIEGAKLQVEKAKRNYDRSKQLFEQSLVPKETFDDAKTELDLANNSLERSDKALRLVEDRISKTKIMAPFDCTVLTRPVSIGQAVSGSGGFNSGTEVMTIANLKDMIITAHISQADVTRLHTGQVVEIEVESVPGLKMKGEVERIAPQATIKSNLKGFSARILIKNIDERVRPGMTANLTIPVNSADGVLAVPLAAIFTERGSRFVYVKKSDSFERRPVQIGITDFNFAEITSGLSPGDDVALTQPDDAKDSGEKGGRGGRGERGSGTGGSGGGGGRSGGTNRTGGGSAPSTPRHAS